MSRKILYHIPNRIWKRIYEYLKKQPKIHTKDEAATRRFVEAIYYLLCNSTKIRALPEYYGNCHTIHQRYMRWARLGIWNGWFKSLQCNDTRYIMIDGTITRAHRCAAGYKKGQNEGLGRSCGGFSSKIHILCDARGSPMEFLVTAGNRHDVTQAIPLIEGYKGITVLADKGYDSQHFVNFIERYDGTAVIPSRSNSIKPRSIDKELYKERHLIECLIGKLKEFRRVFSRFDKTIISYISYIHFAAAIILQR
jgi:transposase